MRVKSLKSFIENFYFRRAFPKYDPIKGFRYEILLEDEKKSMKENLESVKGRFKDNGKITINNRDLKIIGKVSLSIFAYFYNYSFADWPPSPKRVNFVGRTVNNRTDKTLVEILDVGCGAKPVTYELDNHRFHKVGADISERALENALEKEYIQEGWFLDFNQVEKADLPRRSFDYIVMSEVLEHTNNPKAVIEKFSSLLKYDGSLIITIPNPKCVAFLTDFIFHGFKLKKYYKLNRSHNPTVNNKTLKQIINEINADSLKKLLNDKSKHDIYYKFSIVNQENRPAKLYGFFPRDNSPLDRALVKLSKKNPEIFSFQFFYEIKKERLTKKEVDDI